MVKFQNVINKIREIYNEPEAFIPLHAPVFIGNEKKYLTECIDSTFVSSVGKFVDQFENDMANYTGATQAVVCVNGTNALFLALQMVGVESNDEVITQSLTFIATANAISYCGALPVFIDVDKDTLGLSATAVRKWLNANAEIKGGICFNRNTGRRIRACVPMHTFGHPVHLDELIQVCEDYHLELVEDAAESLGSFYKGRHTGTFGKVGILSFNGNKTITTGGGGMLLFNDIELAERAKHITTQAKMPHKWEFSHDEIGYNYRMPNLNAAVGCAQLEQIDKIISSKLSVAEEYKDFFEELSLRFVSAPVDCRSNYWLNAIRLPNRKERDLFLSETNQAGVMTRPIWNLMTDLSMFKICQRDDLRNSRELADTIVNLPSSVTLSRKGPIN